MSGFRPRRWQSKTDSFFCPACLPDVLQLQRYQSYGCPPWTDGFACWWLITTVPDSGGPMATWTQLQSGRLCDGAVSHVHLLGSGVKRNTSVLSFCEASTSGGGMEISCFTAKPPSWFGDTFRVLMHRVMNATSSLGCGPGFFFSLVSGALKCWDGKGMPKRRVTPNIRNATAAGRFALVLKPSPGLQIGLRVRACAQTKPSGHAETNTEKSDI